MATISVGILLLLAIVFRPWPKPEITFLGMVEKQGLEVARFKVHNPHKVSFSYCAHKDGTPSWIEPKKWSDGKWLLLNSDCGTGRGALFGDGWRVLPPDGTIEFEIRQSYLPGSRLLFGIPFLPKIINDPSIGKVSEFRERTMWEKCEARFRGLDGVEWYAWSPPVTFTKECDEEKP